VGPGCGGGGGWRRDWAKCAAKGGAARGRAARGRAESGRHGQDSGHLVL